MKQIPNELISRFDKGELIPAIAQNYSDGKVLMLAWMNRDALEISIKTGFATYWSRSRNKLWKKGETSGNTQELIELSFDCDADAILLKVKQSGPACHTGSDTCFHRSFTFKN